MLNDLRYAFRQLIKNPGFTAVVVLTLALSIGANTTLFSVVNAILLRPLPYQNPDKLVALWMRFTGIGIPKDQNAVSAPEFMDLRRLANSFSHLAAISTTNFNLRVSEIPERVAGAAVSPSLFPLLGVQAQMGRVFLPEEEQVGKDAVAVISHALWQRLFASDRNLIGRSYQVNGRSIQIVGVMPPGFSFPDEAAMWTPLAFTPEQLSPNSRGNHGLAVLARIRDNLSFAQARAELDHRVAEDHRGRCELSLSKVWFPGSDEPDAGGNRRRGSDGLDPPDGSRCLCIADCLRQYREPAAGQRECARAGVRHPNGGWRKPDTAVAATPYRERSAFGVGCWRLACGWLQPAWVFWSQSPAVFCRVWPKSGSMEAFSRSPVFWPSSRV